MQEKMFAQIPIGVVADYWNNRPCNLRHSPHSVGTREYFDEVEARKYKVEPHIPGFADFPRWRGKEVLEVGCGIGTDTINFARHGAQVTAVDLSIKSLEIARQRAELFGLSSRITFVHANGEELSQVLSGESYDLIYSFGVIHHTPHPEKALREIRKLLSPGGVFKIMMYHRHSWKVLWIALRYGKGRFWEIPELVAHHSEAQTGCPVTHTYTRRQLKRLLESCGFRVAEVSVDHIFPYRIDDYVRYRYRKHWYFQCLPPPVFRLLENRWGWHLMATAGGG